jgi:hypothetical protein
MSMDRTNLGEPNLKNLYILSHLRRGYDVMGLL